MKENIADNTKSYMLSITISRFGYSATRPVEIEVPKTIDLDTAKSILRSEHHYLCYTDESHIYEDRGLEPNVLAEYTCEKHGWKYRPITFDESVVLSW